MPSLSSACWLPGLARAPGFFEGLCRGQDVPRRSPAWRLRPEFLRAVAGAKTCLAAMCIDVVGFRLSSAGARPLRGILDIRTAIVPNPNPNPDRNEAVRPPCPIPRPRGAAGVTCACWHLAQGLPSYFPPSSPPMAGASPHVTRPRAERLGGAGGNYGQFFPAARGLDKAPRRSAAALRRHVSRRAPPDGLRSR